MDKADEGKIHGKKVTLSIVVPVYNGSKYIESCINNLDAQTFSDWEAFFVDDGSTDDSLKKMHTLLDCRENIVVVHQENGGTSRARNNGLNRAHGKYIAFLDVDDELHPQMYEKLIRQLESAQADVSICGYFFKIEASGGGETKELYMEQKRYPSAVYSGRGEISQHLLAMWESDILPNVWNKVYRMDLIREYGLHFVDGHIYTEDCVFNFSVLEKCRRLVLTDECLYNYVRERAGSTTERYRDDYFYIRDIEYHDFQNHFKNMGLWNDDTKEFVCRRFLERISGCIENIFHAEKLLTKREQRQQIKAVIGHEDVREALRFARFRSKKMKLLMYPIKRNSSMQAYILYKAIYMIRKANPVIFHKLKSSR